MNTYAVIESGKVVNIIVMDDTSNISENTIHVDCNVGIGWTYVDGEFQPPEQQELTHGELVAMADQQKASLRMTADSEIIWRQDAVDAGMATTEEAASLAAWKKYRVLLMRVDVSLAPDIAWPDMP